MTFQILISTMNGKFFTKDNTLKENILVVNQYTNEPYVGDAVYNYNERGLSKSRNHALEKSHADICLISDDDLEYIEDLKDTVLTAFKENPSADIITFQVISPDGEPFSNYKKDTFWHNKKSIMRVCSVEIALRSEVIKGHHLNFDENFGLGAEFPTGEEVIFLSDALGKSLKVLYVPIPIVIHPLESSGSNYGNMALIQAKGAMFYRLFGSLGYVASALYAYKKNQFSSLNMKDFFLMMLKGIKNYRS
ncbi:MAG: glycosyltransferase family A protein, partial [Campylobacterota bacterium]|nr:glycosyltransferase family A protein [Campylobacterota bacterium]